MPLTDEELKSMAPSLFTTHPHPNVSEKYHFIPTIDVIDEIRHYRWFPVTVQESGVREAAREGFQRHLVRFRHFDDLLDPKEDAVELLLFNSHDRTTAFSIAAGVYRFVCANGLVIADTVFERHTVRHIGERNDDLHRAIQSVTQSRPMLEERIRRFRQTGLDEIEKLAFARAAIPLRFKPHQRVDPARLLQPRREADKRDDLYTVMNVVQETLG
jgi:hypothetical protein